MSRWPQSSPMTPQTDGAAAPPQEEEDVWARIARRRRELGMAGPAASPPAGQRETQSPGPSPPPSPASPGERWTPPRYQPEQRQTPQRETQSPGQSPGQADAGDDGVFKRLEAKRRLLDAVEVPEQRQATDPRFEPMQLDETAEGEREQYVQGRVLDRLAAAAIANGQVPKPPTRWADGRRIPDRENHMRVAREHILATGDPATLEEMQERARREWTDDYAGRQAIDRLEASVRERILESAPPGADVDAQAKRMLASMLGVEEPEELEEFRRKGITAIPREVGAGVGRSFARMSAELPAWAVGLVETARERLTGEAAKPGASVNQSFLRRQEQMIGQYGLSQLANEALPASFTVEGVGKYADPLWWSAIAGEQVPIFASLFTGAAAGAKIAGMAGAGARGVEATRQLASLGSIGSLYASGTYHEGKQLLMKQGMSEEEASLRASIGSAIGGVSAAIFARLPYGEFIARSPAASGRIANAVRGAIVEGTSEALQEASQLLALYGMDAKSPEYADIMRVLDGAIAGGVIGGVFGAARRPTQSPSQQLASEIDQQAGDVATASDIDPVVRAQLARETPEQLATTLIGEREALRNLEEAGPRPGREERFERERQRLRERVEMIEGVYRERTGQEPPAGDRQPTTVEPVDDPFATLPDDATAARPTTPETVPADPARPADRVVAQPPALFDPEARAAEPEAVVQPPPETAEPRVPPPAPEPTPARVEQPPKTVQPDPVAEPAAVPRGTESDAPQQLRQRFRETSPEHARLDDALERMVSPTEPSTGWPGSTLTAESADVIREALIGVEASRLEGIEWNQANIQRPGEVHIYKKEGKLLRRVFLLRRGLAALQQRARDGDPKLSKADRKFWARPDIEGAVAFLHEFGHTQQVLLDPADQKAVERVWKSKSPEEWAKFFTKGLSAESEARVAKYFAKNPSEFFVQSFAEWVLTNRVSDARLKPFLRRVGDAMARALSRVRGRGHLSELEPIYAKIVDGGRTTPVELTDIATLQERTADGEAQKARAETQEQRARQEERRREAGRAQPEAREAAEVLKREPVRGVEGREASLELPDGRTLPVRYVVVEAADLVPSHDPTQGFKPVEGADPNERRYEDPTEGAESRKTVERIGKAPKPDLLLTDTPTATDGPPIVSPAGVVMGGNARSMGMILAHARGNAGDYVQALRKRAQALGLDAGKVEGMERPVLVRVVPQKHVGKPGELSRILNEPLTTTRSEITDAVSRGRSITHETAARIAGIIDEGTIRSALGQPAKATRIVQALRQSGSFSDAELSRFFRGGEITDAGKLAIEQALLAAALGDVRTMAEMAPSVEQVLISSLPSIVMLNRPAQAGGDPTFAGSLALAVEGFSDYRRSGLKMDKYFAQSTMTPRPWTDDPRAVALIRAFDSDKATRLRKRLSEMAQAVEDAQSGQATFLGQTPTTEGAFRDAFEEYGAPPPPRGETVRKRLSRGKALEYVRRTSADPDALDAEATRQIIEMQDSDFELRRIPISAIDRIMGESRINPDKVAKYARELGQSEAPPILAGLVNGELTVIDGKHRWAAAREAGLTQIDAFVPIRHSVEDMGQVHEYGMPTSPDESTIQQLRRRINRMKKALEKAKDGKAEARRRVGERLARAEIELAEYEQPQREARARESFLRENSERAQEVFERAKERLPDYEGVGAGWILPDGDARGTARPGVGFSHWGAAEASGARSIAEMLSLGAVRMWTYGDRTEIQIVQPMTSKQSKFISDTHTDGSPFTVEVSNASVEFASIAHYELHTNAPMRVVRAALARANRVARGLEPGRRTFGGPPPSRGETIQQLRRRINRMKKALEGAKDGKAESRRRVGERLARAEIELAEYEQPRRDAEAKAKFLRERAEEADKAFRDAVKEFGTTDRIERAGYILPDGRMLEMVEDRTAPRGQRDIDHREVRRFVQKEPGDQIGTSAMVRFQNLGALRINPFGEGLGIDISQPLTDAQIRRIVDSLDDGRDLYVDVSDLDGATIHIDKVEGGTKRQLRAALARANRVARGLEPGRRTFGGPPAPRGETIQQLRRRINRMKKALEGAKDGKAESRRRVGERLARAEAELAEFERPQREARARESFLRENSERAQEVFERAKADLSPLEGRGRAWLLPDGDLRDAREDHAFAAESAGSSYSEMLALGAARVGFLHSGETFAHFVSPISKSQINAMAAEHADGNRFVISVTDADNVSKHTSIVDSADERALRAALARANRVARGLEPGRRTFGGPPAPGRDLDGLGFHSRLQRTALAKIQGPMTTKQIVATLKNNGVSPDEMTWTGILDLLEADPDRRWTPAEIAEHIEHSRMRLVENWRSETLAHDPQARKDIADAQKEVEEANREWRESKYKIQTWLEEKMRPVLPDVYRGKSLIDDFEAVRIINALGAETYPGDGTARPETTVLAVDEVLRYRMRMALAYTTSDQSLRREWANEITNLLMADQKTGRMLLDRHEATVSRHSLASVNAQAIRDRYNINQPAYEDWTLPGGENYREVLLQVPGWTDQPIVSAEGRYQGWPYKSPHWSDRNVVAHIRIKDRQTEHGELTLFLEEIQSDWMQEARERGMVYDRLPEGFWVEEGGPEGYRVIGPHMDPYYSHLTEHTHAFGPTPAAAEMRALQYINSERIPQGPFSKTWHEMAFRRAAMMAVQQNARYLAWAPADVHVERYGGSGADFRRGMEEFYNKILRRYAEKFGKKFGAKVETIRVTLDTDFVDRPRHRDIEVPALRITNEMRESLGEDGVQLFGPLPPMPSPRSKALRLARGSTELLGAARNWMSEEMVRAVPLQAGQWGRETLRPKVERVLDKQKEMYGQLRDVRLAALREIRGKIAASWSLQEVDYGDRNYGVARIVDAVEGRIPLEQLSVDERGFVEKYREVVAETGKLLEDQKFLQWIPGEGGEPGRLEPFRRTPGGKVFLRSATSALRDLYLNPSGPAWSAYVEAVAAMNGMKPAEARERALKMARNPFARIGPELTRVFPKHPTAIIVEIGGIKRRIPLLHTDPFAAVESMVRDTVTRAGFASEFGQSWRGVPGKEAEGLWEAQGEGMMTQIEMDRSQFELAGGDPKAFDQLMRALSGLQTHEPIARPGTAAHEVMEVVSTAASTIRSIMLSRAAVPNIPEWLGNIRAFGGTNRAIRALADVARPTRSIIEGLEKSGLVEPGAIPETGREMIDLLERMGVVSFDMARYTIDRDRAFQSFARLFGDRVTRMFGTRAAWTWQERHGAMTGLRMAVDMKNGKGSVFDFLTLRGFGFERADALRLMRGEGTNAEYLTFVRRFATRSNSTVLTLPAEESRAINNRHWRNWFWFTRYPTMKARTMYRTIATMAEAVNEVRKNPTAENRKVAGASIVRLADSLAGTAASGAVAHLFLAFLMGGKAGIGVALDDWREDPIEMAAKSFTYSMFGPIITSLLRVGTDKRIEQAWRASAGASVLADLVSAAVPDGLGEYFGMSPVERYSRFAQRYTPVSRPIGTAAATLGLGSKDAELETAISAYWRQTGREEEGESRRFRMEMRRAADLMRTSNPMDEDHQAKIRERIAAALNVKESELEGDTREARRRVAQSLRSRRLLTRMNEEQRKAFNDRHGDAIFNRIKAHDELLEEWARAISRGADAPRGGAGTR